MVAPIPPDSNGTEGTVPEGEATADIRSEGRAVLHMSELLL